MEIRPSDLTGDYVLLYFSEGWAAYRIAERRRNGTVTTYSRHSDRRLVWHSRKRLKLRSPMQLDRRDEFALVTESDLVALKLLGVELEYIMEERA